MNDCTSSLVRYVWLVVVSCCGWFVVFFFLRLTFRCYACGVYKGSG